MMCKPGNGFPVGGFRGLQIEYVNAYEMSVGDSLISTMMHQTGNDVSGTHFSYELNDEIGRWNAEPFTWRVNDPVYDKLPAFVWTKNQSYVPEMPAIGGGYYYPGEKYMMAGSGSGATAPDISGAYNVPARCNSITMVWAEQFNPSVICFGGGRSNGRDKNFTGIKKINFFQTTDISNMNQFTLLASSFGYPQTNIQPLLPNDINALRFGLPTGADGKDTRYANSVAQTGPLLQGHVYSGSSGMLNITNAFKDQTGAPANRISTAYCSVGVDADWNLTAWGGGTATSPNYANYGKYLGSDAPTNGIAGPYIQVDLGVATRVRWAFIFGVYMDRVVVFGSNNNSTWVQLRDYDDMAGLKYGNTAEWYPMGMFANDNIELDHNNVDYRYIRFVVNRGGAGVVGGNSGVQIPQIFQVYIYGIDPTYPPTYGGTTYPLDASGVACPALKSIFEQLMNVSGRSQIMETRDISNGKSEAGGFPFIAGDKLVMYLRPKIVFSAQTFAEQSTTLTGFGLPNEPKIQVPVYDVGRKSSAGGAISGQTYTESSAYSTDFKFDKCFEGAYNDTANHWYSGDNQFHDVAPFDHDGGYTTTNVDGSTTLSGSWGQVDIGQNTYINKYILWASGFTTRRPDEYSLLGSLNGTNWTTIKYVTEILGDGVASPIVTVILSSAQGPYRYYRLSIKSVNGNGKQLSMNGLLLYGAKESEVIIGQPHADYITDISGLVTNVAAIAANIETAFPGNATTGPEPEINKWGWMGSANSDSLSLETTDIQDVQTCDLHIWKVTITL